MPAHKKVNSRKSRKDLLVDFDDPVNGDPPILSPDSLTSPPIIRNGEVMSPLSNGRSMFEFSLDEKVANLTNLNNTLVREVTSLRIDKDNLTGRMKELEKQLQDDAISRDLLVRENQELKTDKEDVSAKVLALERDTLVLTEEKAALCKDSAALLKDKENLQSALLEAMQNLADSLKQVEQSESSVASGKARMDALDDDVQKFLTYSKTLNEENASLKLLISERDRDLKELGARMITMEEERQSLVSELEQAVESGDNAKRTMEALRSESVRLEEENVMRELEKEKLQVIDMLQQLKAELAFLQKELILAKSKEDKALLELEKEQEVKRDLLREVSMVASTKKMLEESLNSTLTSLDKFRENAERKESQVLSLEEHVALLSKEIADLQKSKHDVELDLQTRITVLTNEVCSKQAENSLLKQKLSSLEMLLWDMEKEAKSGERTLWELVSELRSVQALFDKKAQVAKYAVPIATVSSGTLAFVGLLAYLRFRKKH